MDRDDFKRWYAAHRAAFPSVDSWMGKMPREPNQETGELSMREVLGQWFDALQAESLADCLAATRGMNRGDLEVPDSRAVENHARFVRRHAAEIRTSRTKQAAITPPKRVNGEIAYKCPKCWDTGLCTVLQPSAMRLVCRGEVEHRSQLKTTGVRCHCDAGQNFRNTFFLELREHSMCLAPASPTLEDVPRFVEWFDTRAERMENYEPAFADFNNR